MNSASNKKFQYPLGQNHRDDIVTKSGRPLSELELSQVLSGNVDPDDVSINAETLELQAQFASEAGYREVAENLLRAAEMTRIPNAEILEIYETMRPGRSSYYQLLSLSQQVISKYLAEYTGAYIREAADVYRDTGLLRVDED